MGSEMLMGAHKMQRIASAMTFLQQYHKLRGCSLQANYTDRATAACRQS
jgi:hypothetical protein